MANAIASKSNLRQICRYFSYSSLRSTDPSSPMEFSALYTTVLSQIHNRIFVLVTMEYGLWRYSISFCAQVLPLLLSNKRNQEQKYLRKLNLVPANNPVNRITLLSREDLFEAGELLASKMYDTAKGIINNLISLIDEFGYVLNGARAYYTNRMYYLANVNGESSTAEHYTAIAHTRVKAMNSVFWNAEKGQISVT